MRRSLLAAPVLLLVLGLVQAQALDGFDRVLPLLQPAQRAVLEAHARLWAGWTPAQRDAFAARAQAWDALPVRERQQRREAWRAWSTLTAGEREQLRATAARLSALAPVERQALHQRFDALPGSVQRGWMLGPLLGADYAGLQPLLAQVPVDEQDGLLRALRALTPLQRADLAVLVRRTPPQARGQLRRELVSTSDANRAAWLRLRLER